MSFVLDEISALSQKDCFYIVERHKSEFTYPLHQHREFELNFVQNAAGVRRVIGDSVEEIGEFDLVLIAAENLEHVWEQENCKSKDIREITIQFSPDLFDGSLFTRNQFAGINTMLEKARHGLAFPLDAIMKVYNDLDTVASEKDSFEQFMKCLHILYELSGYNYKELSSSSWAKAPRTNESKRVMKVKEYINQHYGENIKLSELADIADMSASAFSRFFKTRTGRTVSSYINDIRLGNAARQLVDSPLNISEICFACGFNNLSNFNRIFKNRRGMSPREFRQIYKKKKVLV